MSGPRYTLPAALLHWLHALLVISLLGLGWYLTGLPKGAERSAAIGLHKSLGLIALALVLLRAGWRLGHQPPPPLPDSPWKHRLAELTHGLLYALLLIVPVAGFLSASFTKYQMKFFGIPLPRLFAPDDSLNEVFHNLHEGAIWVLVTLLGLHLAGVAYHLARRDGLIKRILPGWTTEP
ncbi:MAG: cytochrome b/b6 domain-containing protein [Betaproteobacteria bacterium]|nr:cytochrome b/b6 domain-containing protein [Betaproteobacteria bacterium]